MQFWKGNLPRNIQLMLEFLKGSFLVLHFSYYRLVTFLMMLSVRLLSMMVILLSTLNVIRHLICGNNQNWCLNLNLTYRTTWIAIDVKMDGSVLEKKSSFKMLGGVILGQNFVRLSDVALNDIYIFSKTFIKSSLNML